jgi:hypothetical protein
VVLVRTHSQPRGDRTDWVDALNYTIRDDHGTGWSTAARHSIQLRIVGSIILAW